MEKKYKLKHWWWKIWKPKDYLIDLTVYKISASNPANDKITKELGFEFLEKYFIQR
jgi:hypothetical protein